MQKCSLCKRDLPNWRGTVLVEFVPMEDSSRDSLRNYNCVICSKCKNSLAKALMSRKAYHLEKE